VRYRLERASNGWQYYFTMMSDNHETLMTSQMYVQKKCAIEAINMIRREAVRGAIEDRS
jgi:uncharacterized protein YegP (UPF0339 family)